MRPQKHPARPRLAISQSPGTAESRTRGADCLAVLQTLPKSRNPTVFVSMQDSMARTKKTKRIENSDGSSFRVQISELSDQPPDTAGTQGGPSAESSEEGAKIAPSHFTVDLASQQTAPEEEEGSAP
ncbi:unnamed protein product [Amaranthus hypochondriacus]